MNNLSHDSTDELLRWLANAKTTQAMALGHTKAEMNRKLVWLYEKELTHRKVEIPTDQQLYDKGVFNGVGST